MSLSLRMFVACLQFSSLGQFSFLQNLSSFGSMLQQRISLYVLINIIPKLVIINQSLIFISKFHFHQQKPQMRLFYSLNKYNLQHHQFTIFQRSCGLQFISFLYRSNQLHKLVRMKKKSTYNQKTHDQYYRSNALIRIQDNFCGNTSFIPASPTKVKKKKLIQAEQFKLESNSRGKRQSNSRVKFKMRKLSSIMFKQAHIVKGQTYLTKNQSPNRIIRFESYEKRLKKSSSYHALRTMNSQSKLQIKKVIQIKVKAEESFLTRQIMNFSNQQDQKWKNKINQIQSIPQIPLDVLKVTYKQQDCNQTILDIMKSM